MSSVWYTSRSVIIHQPAENWHYNGNIEKNRFLWRFKASVNPNTLFQEVFCNWASNSPVFATLWANRSRRAWMSFLRLSKFSPSKAFSAASVVFVNVAFPRVSPTCSYSLWRPVSQGCSQGFEKANNTKKMAVATFLCLNRIYRHHKHMCNDNNNHQKRLGLAYIGQLLSSLGWRHSHVAVMRGGLGEINSGVYMCEPVYVQFSRG